MTSTNREPAPVLVIGAGLAGLTAAHRLADAGVAVAVVEARDRVGGRTYSVRDGFAAGQHCDLGAELITDEYRELTALCRRLGVELSDEVWIERPEASPGETALERYLVEGRIVVGGELLTGDSFGTAAHELRTAIQTSPPAPHEPIAQWSRRAGLSELARGALAGFARMPEQSDPFQVDAHYLLGGHIAAIRRIVGGSQTLANTLARGLDVRLSTAVRTVRQAGGGVRVDLENGDTWTGRQVIVAVPPFLLPTIGFDPPLPPPQLGALTSLQRSWGGKVIGQYAEGDAVRRALGRAVFTDGPVNTAWVSNPYVTEGPAVVTGFICGVERAVLESEALAVAALDAVVEVAVGTPVTRLASLTKNWTADPLALGMGAMPSVSQRGALVAVFATPERRVHFAGDYTDVELCGTMEGAVRSGQRAATEVLRMPDRMSLAEIESRLVRA